jgi:diguanylate cyclase (GGDEF)-like protein/PAS domain S-box-containing protein
MDQSIHTTMLEHLFEGVYFVDPERRIAFWNRAAEELTGFPRNEVIGHICADSILQHVDSEGKMLCFGGCPLQKTLDDGQNRETEIFLHHKDGHRVPVSVRVAAVRNEKGDIIGAMEIFRHAGDEIAMRNRVADLEKMAFIDTLTGLPNRRYLISQITGRLEQLKRYQWPVGLLFMDVDQFKEVNDTHGHNVGDGLLKMVGSTLGQTARSFDIVGRFAGDEFIGVISNVDLEKLVAVGERFRVMVAASALRAPVELCTTISIGAAMARETDTADELIKRADKKLYQAKNAGRNRICS